MANTEKPAAEYLGDMIAIFEQPDSHTKEQRARDASGSTVDPQDPNACQWCLEGAGIKVGILNKLGVVAYGPEPYLNKSNAWRFVRDEAMRRIMQGVKLQPNHGASIVSFNDAPEVTQTEILDLLKAAQKEARKHDNSTGLYKKPE